MKPQPRPTKRNAITCSSWPFEVDCRKLAKVAATIHAGLTVPLCVECTENLRRAGRLVESWGSAHAVDFAARYHAAYPDVWLPTYDPE